MSCAGPAHELATENVLRGNALVLRLLVLGTRFPVGDGQFVLPSGTQQSTRAFSLVRETPRLWTTARFWFSILPGSTRERALHSRYAGNQHHGNVFLVDVHETHATATFL